MPWSGGNGVRQEKEAETSKSDETGSYLGTVWHLKARNSLGSLVILAKSPCRSTILPSACENAFIEVFGKPRNTTTPPARAVSWRSSRSAFGGIDRLAKAISCGASPPLAAAFVAAP